MSFRKVFPLFFILASGSGVTILVLLEFGIISRLPSVPVMLFLVILLAIKAFIGAFLKLAWFIVWRRIRGGIGAGVKARVAH
jgi:hypothetical protein